MMRQIAQTLCRVGRGVMSHRFPKQADYLPVYPMCLGAQFPPTKNQGGCVYPIFVVRASAVTICSAPPWSTVQLVRAHADCLVAASIATP
jgi:hypothetical protein